MIQAVVFDSDGVLVDTETVAAAVLRECLAEVGLRLPHSTVYREFVRRAPDTSLDEVGRRHGILLPRGFEGAFRARRQAALHTRLRPMPGASECIGALRLRSLDIAVATQGSREKALLALRVSGLDELVGDVVVTGKPPLRAKPHPDVYLAAARLLKREPSTCVAVDDHPAGLAAARRAGMATIGYAGAPLVPVEEVALHADEVVRDLREIPGLLLVSQWRRARAGFGTAS